ncbi:unnamed protein product [Leptosia nina]|uniref:Uncharacterized protein n=1 Tax=Leptosia nina TaxID=320188 RepID=A0AAV1ITD3_9NEOP
MTNRYSACKQETLTICEKCQQRSGVFFPIDRLHGKGSKILIPSAPGNLPQSGPVTAPTGARAGCTTKRDPKRDVAHFNELRRQILDAFEGKIETVY